MGNSNTPGHGDASSGLTLAGRYTVLNLLGQGGMGVVLAAYDSRLDRRVALKLLHPSQAGPGSGEVLRARLVREAQAMARLSHPHVVAVYDAGTLEDGRIFLAMEYVEGQTLRPWLQEKPRSWREVLGAYLEAGRGLAAAHAAGLVHRDFKPDNVLVGQDGRVRVTDFGAARAQTGFTDSVSMSPPPLSQREKELPAATLQTLPEGVWERSLTLPGRVVGTLKYLAPELMQGQPPDARSDLFAFCVALYESLFRQPAFGSDSSREGRLQAQRTGQVNPPPAKTDVPPWVTRAILQGLQVNPSQRPASMAALLATLEDDPAVQRRRRRRVAAVAGGVLVLAGLAMGAWWRSSGPSCAELTQSRLAGVWDESLRTRVREALLGTGLFYAQSTSQRVEAALSKYATRWARLRTAACEAGRATDPRRQRLAVLQVYCLERRRSQLRALTELWARGVDRELLPKAVETVRTLPPLDYCIDEKALTAAVPPPEDPLVRARVDALQEQVDRLEALREAGQYREGLPPGERLLRDTAAVGWAPLHARALLLVAGLRERAGDYAVAEALAREAIPLAARGGDDVLVAKVWGALVWSVGVGQAHQQEALGLRLALEAAAARAGDGLTHAESLTILATVFRKMGRNEDALALHERALAIREQTLAPEHPTVASSLNNLGAALFDLGQHAQARAQMERALALWEKALGPEHPTVADSLNNLGAVLQSLGQYEEAWARHERALAIREKTLGPEHPVVAQSLHNLSVVLRDLGRYEQALALHERALAIREKTLGPEHPNVAASHCALGRTLVQLGALETAKRHLEHALALLEKAPRPEHSRLVDALLGLGELQRALGRPAQAVPRLERALAMARERAHAEVQFQLAQALWDVGADRPRALALATEAHEHLLRLGHAPRAAEASRWLAAQARP